MLNDLGNISKKMEIFHDYCHYGSYHYRPPSPLMALVSIPLLIQLFSLAIESCIYETDFTLGTLPFHINKKK